MNKVRLTDGTELVNLELNGNNFISDTIIEDTIFENNLSTVSVFEDETETVYKNMKLIQNKIYDNQSWFILAEKTEADILKEEVNLLRKKVDAVETEATNLKIDLDSVKKSMLASK